MSEETPTGEADLPKNVSASGTTTGIATTETESHNVTSSDPLEAEASGVETTDTSGVIETAEVLYGVDNTTLSVATTEPLPVVEETDVFPFTAALVTPVENGIEKSEDVKTVQSNVGEKPETELVHSSDIKTVDINIKEDLVTSTIPSADVKPSETILEEKPENGQVYQHDTKGSPLNVEEKHDIEKVELSTNVPSISTDSIEVPHVAETISSEKDLFVERIEEEIKFSEPAHTATSSTAKTAGDITAGKVIESSTAGNASPVISESPDISQSRDSFDFTENTTDSVKRKEPTATVKFLLLPNQQVITIASPINLSIEVLKQQLADGIKVPAQIIRLSYNKQFLLDATTLRDLDVQPNGTIQLNVTSSNPELALLKPTKAGRELGSSDVITVRLMKENNEYKDVVVEIERTYRRKPYLGGYRHRLTGAEFHHASAQTQDKPRPKSAVKKFTRDCQTMLEQNRTTQTTNTTSTQMTKIGCYVSTVTDKVIVSGEYKTAGTYYDSKLEAVIVIQAYFRRWQARNVVDELKQDRNRRIEWEKQEEIRKGIEKDLRVKKEFGRRMNPKTKKDFDLLYAALEKWRLEEMGHINSELDGPERKAALCALLEQEAQLIASIGRHEIEASKENKEKSIEKFLGKAAAPKRWKTYDGRYTEMDTQYTIRAKEMKDIYNSVNMKFLAQDERLDILLTLKHTVKDYDCKLTRDIIELIDREADLLMRGVPHAHLDGLRKRISTLFLQYCKNPLFNPEVAKLLKVPQNPSSIRKDIYFCPSANQYLPSTEFNIMANSRTVGKCRKAQDLDNTARARHDYSHYKVMLRDLRRAEEKFDDDSKIAYLIQEKDLQHLVENVWGCQSILSAWNDLFDLVLLRWDRDEQWSPWNCILLTKDEAMSHSRLDHLDEAYGHIFIQKVKNKHTLARIYFSRVPGMSDKLRRRSNDSHLYGQSEIRGRNALNVNQ